MAKIAALLDSVELKTAPHRRRILSWIHAKAVKCSLRDEPFRKRKLHPMGYNHRDKYFLKAKKEGFAARSVYKLQEIDQQFKIFRQGQTVLDLGASPGSWSQYASEKIGSGGRLLGVDLSPVTVSMANSVFIQADLRDLTLDEVFQKHGFQGSFDIVMSDMAPKTTGIRFADQARSLELCELALEVAHRFLKPNGTFICKFFQSGEFGNLRSKIKKDYERVTAVKPESTRSISKEIFLVGLKKKVTSRPALNAEADLATQLGYTIDDEDDGMGW